LPCRLAAKPFCLPTWPGWPSLGFPARLRTHGPAAVDRIRAANPFFFLRAGTLIHASALVSGAGVIAVLLAVKLVSKGIAVWPTAARFRLQKRERAYTTLLMATGLTFGSIAALLGLTTT
jgi:hypothetical protein